jgi:hypothetical protein
VTLSFAYLLSRCRAGMSMSLHRPETHMGPTLDCLATAQSKQNAPIIIERVEAGSESNAGSGQHCQGDRHGFALLDRVKFLVIHAQEDETAFKLAKVTNIRSSSGVSCLVPQLRSP